MSELDAPLRARTRALASTRLPVRAVAIGAASLALLAAGLYMAFAGNPLGGEPVAIARLERPSADQAQDIATPAAQRPATGNVVVVRRPGGMEVTEVPVEAEESTAGELRIIRPGEEAYATLAAVPDPRLVEETQAGLLPRRGADGSSPAETYARPAPPPSGKARIALLVTGAGLNGGLTSEAIRLLPGEATLAFAPYGQTLQDWVGRARSAGHEVMLQVPLEPFDYPESDPGPHTLLTSLAPQENLERLHWVMSRLVGYTGLTNYMGARFSSDADALRMLLLEAKKRGLIYVDDGASPRSLVGALSAELGLATSEANVMLDAVPSGEAIADGLKRLEAAALKNGTATGVLSILPLSVQMVAEWAKTLPARGFELIPVSATARVAAQG